MPETQSYPSFRDLLERHFELNISARELTSMTCEIRFSGYAYSASKVYVGQTCFHPTDEDVDQLLQILQRFHEIFPMHSSQKIHGVFAAKDIPEKIRDRIWREGLYLATIVDSDDFNYQYQIEIPEGFHPRAF